MDETTAMYVKLTAGLAMEITKTNVFYTDFLTIPANEFAEANKLYRAGQYHAEKARNYERNKQFHFIKEECKQAIDFYTQALYKFTKTAISLQYILVDQPLRSDLKGFIFTPETKVNEVDCLFQLAEAKGNNTKILFDFLVKTNAISPPFKRYVMDNAVDAAKWMQSALVDRGAITRLDVMKKLDDAAYNLKGVIYIFTIVFNVIHKVLMNRASLEDLPKEYQR